MRPAGWKRLWLNVRLRPHVANSERSEGGRLMKRRPVALTLFLQKNPGQRRGRKHNSCDTHVRRREKKPSLTFPISNSLQAMTITCNTEQTRCVCVWRGVDLDVILPDHPPEVRHRGAQWTLRRDVGAGLCRPLEAKCCITKQSGEGGGVFTWMKLALM